AVLTQSQLGWWGERRDLPRLDVVVGHIGDEVTHHRERAHRRHGDDLVLAEGRQPRHTQQARPTVDLRRAGTAFARLAIPPYGQIRRLGGLQSVDQVEHDLTLVGLDGVVPQFTGPVIPTPDPQFRPVPHVRPSFPDARPVPRRCSTSPVRRARTGRTGRPASASAPSWSPRYAEAALHDQWPNTRAAP